jgi:hypothetical protein
MTTRRIAIAFLLVVVTAVISCVAPRVWPTNVFASSSDIRISLLKQTPLGSRRDHVDAYLRSASYRSKYMDMRGYETGGYPTSMPASSAVIAVLPRYYAPFRVDVEAVYAFDSRGRLIGIEVNKYVDAL